MSEAPRLIDEPVDIAWALRNAASSGGFLPLMPVAAISMSSAAELESRLIEMGFVEGAQRGNPSRRHVRQGSDRRPRRQRDGRHPPPRSDGHHGCLTHAMHRLPLPLRCNLALVGTPNSGKTSLFNALTGSRQQVAQLSRGHRRRKEDPADSDAGGAGRSRLLDLPGTYSLRGRSPDEEITRDSRVRRRLANETIPDLHRLRRRRDQPAAQPPSGCWN